MTETDDIELETVHISENKPDKKSHSRWFILGAALLIAGAGITWWVLAQRYESTDDAQIEGHLDSISPRISGTVTYIDPRVENNQFVEAGTLLLELDPRDFEADLEHAKANLHSRECRGAVRTNNDSDRGRQRVRSAPRGGGSARASGRQRRF